MLKSKMAFFIIAAILIAVILIIILGPKSPVITPTEPSTTVPSTGGSTGPTETYPISTGTSPGIVPTEPTYPRETFVPGETDFADLPPSDGRNYRNKLPISIGMSWDCFGETSFVLDFGVQIGTANYLCLSPAVRTMDENWFDLFQFTFTAADGYVATISTAEHGESKGSGHFVFGRSFDYALPAQYIDDNNWGVVWFMPEGASLARNSSTYVDVKVYANGSMLATVRLVIVCDADGMYMLDQLINLNQLDNPEKLTDAQLSQLMDQAWNDGYDEQYECNLGGDVTGAYTKDDFIIEWREVGQGTYFTHTSTLSGRDEFIASEDLAATPLIAVTHRRNRWEAKYAPITLYYKVLEGAGENGEDLYELVGIDHQYHYWSYYLYYDGFPGYSVLDET